ncbi:hypothetical protein HOS33_gp187 [Erwinia phage vB_EamM_Y3]|uniref:Uncharacterized protein n=1 Tax=Erwinia phage vB_EamM_Y3 TaxID=1983553 RepID=A0A2H4IB97_9CAUD|nr:hypothetical protein HOS33_gp187 [Erwinia phage vB_EamM_Y3]ARW58827.1 hypothetical protein Y3_187 [Erwinia phage vB_EamM_Y3]
MSLIRLKLDGSNIVSESAAKTPAHIFAQVSGATTLVIDKSHKATVAAALSAAKKAKKLAAGALKAKIDSTTAHSQASRAEGAAKTKLVTKYKTLKTKASADAKAAKELLRTAAASLRKAGLSSLSLALPASVITLTTGPGRSLRTVNAAQVDQVRIKGKKGTFKPKFGDVAKILASSGKKPSHAESVRIGKKKIEAKIAAKRKGAVTGAHTPAKAKELEAQRNNRFGKTMKPGGAERRAAALAEQKKENAKNLKGLKEFIGGDFKASSLKNMSYGPTDKKGGITLYDIKNDKTIHLNAAAAKKHNIDVEELEGLLETKGIHYDSSLKQGKK